MVTGADRVARFLVGVVTRQAGWQPHLLEVHGAPGLVWRDDAGTAVAAMSATVGDGSRIVSVSLVVNPDKLWHLDAHRGAHGRGRQGG